MALDEKYIKKVTEDANNYGPNDPFHPEGETTKSTKKSTKSDNYINKVSGNYLMNYQS